MWNLGKGGTETPTPHESFLRGAAEDDWHLASISSHRHHNDRKRQQHPCAAGRIRPSRGGRLRGNRRGV